MSDTLRDDEIRGDVREGDAWSEAPPADEDTGDVDADDADVDADDADQDADADDPS